MELLAVLAVPLSSAHYIRSHFPRKRGQLPLRQFPPQPMTITFIQYIIVCPLIFLAGFVDAIAGGGGLISLPAYMLAGLPVHNAIGTNKLSSAMGATLTTVRFAKSGFIELRFAIPCSAAALLGSAIGARIALLIPEHVFKIIMLFVLPLVAAYVMSKKSLKDRSELEPFPFTKAIIIAVLCALFIGMYDGFYGPGTGTFLLLLLTGAARMPLNDSAGITKVINLSSNIAALAVYIFSGNVLYPLGLAAGVFSIAGNYLGTRVFTAKGSRGVKPIMITVLGIFFIKLCYELFFAK